MSAASSDSRHMMSSVSITAASLHHQRAAPLLVEVVEELVASGREPRDVDRDRPTGRHHALAVQLEALELDRRRGLVRELRAEPRARRSEEHTSELQSHSDIVCRLLLEKKKKIENPRGTDTAH